MVTPVRSKRALRGQISLQIGNASFSVQTASHPFDKNFDPFSSRDESSDQCCYTLKWSLGDLDALAGLQRLIHLHDFITAGPHSDFIDQGVRQQRQTLPELYETADTGFVSDLPMECCIVESRKEVAWKHGFDEPDRPTIGPLPQTDAGTENLHFGHLAQASRRDMFSFGLGP